MKLIAKINNGQRWNWSPVHDGKNKEREKNKKLDDEKVEHDGIVITTGGECMKWSWLEIWDLRPGHDTYK